MKPDKDSLLSFSDIEVRALEIYALQRYLHAKTSHERIMHRHDLNHSVGPANLAKAMALISSEVRVGRISHQLGQALLKYLISAYVSVQISETASWIENYTEKAVLNALSSTKDMIKDG